MYLILCWSYLNHFFTFCWEKKRIKKNRISNRNRNILVKKSQLDYFPKSFSPIAYPTCHDPAHDLLILVHVFPLFCPVLCFCSLCLLPWLVMCSFVYFLSSMCFRCPLCLCSRPFPYSLVCLIVPCPPVSRSE